MATVNYRVRSPKKGKLATLHLRLRDGKDIDLSIPTAFKIYPEYWNNESQTFKQRIAFTETFTEEDKNKLAEGFLDLRNMVLKKYNQQSASGGFVSQEWLKSVINDFHNKASVSTKETLNDFIARFIKEIETGARLYDHNNRVERYKEGTIKNYKGFKEQFNLFQDDQKRKFDFDDITIDLYDKLMQYFTDKGYSPNTMGRHIKNLLVIMRTSRELGLHMNNEIDRKKFKVIKASVQDIFLEEDELKAMLELDLSKQPEMDIARDVFLVGCYTAQRFSDYSRIRKENIRKLSDGSMVIDIQQKKTGEQVLIPMRPELVRILEKYDYTLPKTYEQKVNLNIKKVGEKAKITAPIIKETIRGGLKVTKEVTKNQLIKTHTARRTGCTLMFLAGIPSISIMKISGHKSEREFLTYIKVGKEETAQKLNVHPYFTQVKLKVV